MSNDKEIFEQYVSVMGKIMQPEVEPCEDFVEYATGNYSEEMEWFPPSDFSSAIHRILKNEDIDLPSFVKARDFYNSCKNETNFKELLKKSHFYESFGGWPAYKSDWNSNNFDWITAAAQLASLGMQTILSHEIQYNEVTTRKNVKVAAQKPTEEDKAGEVLQLLGVTDDFVPEILKDIQFMVAKLKAVPPMKFPKISTYCQETIIPFKELNEEEFDYNKYFLTYFGKPANDSDEIWLENKEYFDNYLKVFKNSDSKQIANYMFWMAGKKFLKGDIPLKLTIEFFTPSLIATLFTIYYNKNDYEKSMYVLNKYVTKFEEIKKQYNKCDPEQVEYYLKRINAALEIKVLHFQQKAIEESYASLEIISENFLQNLRNLQAHYPTKTQSFCSSSDEVHQCIKYLRLLQFFPPVVFNHNKPMLHHLIGNGLRIWVETNYCFLNDIVDTKSLKYTNEVLEKQMKELNVKNEDGTLLIKAYAVSLKQIFADYKEWLRLNPEDALYQEDILRPLGLNNEKAFFVAYAQRFAYKLPEFRWPAALSLCNIKEFSDVFKCKIRSNLNRSGKFLF